MNPMFLMFWFWSATIDAMKLASEEMFLVKPPVKLVLIIGGKR
ncbi:hypothetical protein ACLJYM_06310 [Rhizobium giardinii]